MRIFRLLSFRLFVLICIVLAALSFIVSYIQLNSQSKNYTEMITAYQSMDKPDFVNYARGMQALAHKDYTAALAYLEPAAQTLPEFAPVHIGLGLTYESLHRYPEALSTIEEALALSPDDFMAQQAYGRLKSITQ